MTDVPAESPQPDFQKAHTTLRLIAGKIRGEHGRDEDTCSICNGAEVLAIRAALGAAEAELSRLREDKERLDWLESRKDWRVEDSKGGIVGEIHASIPFRAAIDMARSASPMTHQHDA